jgi:hypothetical protein
MNGENASLERGLGRVEARVSDLTGQITSLRTEFSQLAQAMEAEIAGHRERIAALEAFRRWMIGLMTGLFMSGAAAVFALILRR